jgi:Zn-dependent protease with chaperone function
MDFFEHQDQARRNSKKLVFLFGLAMLGVMASVYLLIAVAMTGINSQTGPEGQQIDVVTLLTDWKIILLVGGGTLLLIGGASAFRIASLSGGGSVVASSLGGRPLGHDTPDPDERKILNVVEEMAIASGIPVPPVYLLEEAGINAFAAGFSPDDAVIGVTRGCVKQLSRDELQGVIAHEFSHILNGDMRINIRMIGVIYGIMVIGFIGWQVFRIALYSGGGRRSNKDSSPIPLIAIGGGLILVGAVGTFFGNWIKSSLSRQREFLADASAVQFTRNPDGIGGALKQIGATPAQGLLKSKAAPEFSHMYFTSGISGAFSSMFASHPPLEKRILRIEPRWDGKFPSEQRARRRKDSRPSPKAEPKSQRERMAQVATVLAGVEAIGQPTPQHIALASELISEIPETVKNAARDPYGARAVLFALLLNEDPVARKKQLDQLKRHADQGLAELTENMSRQKSTMDRRHRLPLIDMTLGALSTLSPTQYKNFKTNLEVLVAADEQVDLFEWVLLRIVDHHLGKPRRPSPLYQGLDRLREPCNTLLSTLAWAGNPDPAEVQKAFDAGAQVIKTGGLNLIPREKLSLQNLGSALDTLDRIEMGRKKILLTACAKLIYADQQVTPSEAELMRAIAESLGCPMPPLLPGQALV